MGHLSLPFLFGAARNRALKYLRHRRVVAAWIERASYEEPPMADSPEDECLRRELDDAVRRAIAELPGRCREIFVLHRRDELSYQEIAARLGLSLGTVKSQMWRATVRLKQRLTPRSEEHTSELQSQSNLVCRLLLEKKKLSTCQYCIVNTYLATSVRPAENLT